MIAPSDRKLRKPPGPLSSKASIRPLEQPGSKGEDSSRSILSTSSSGMSNKSRDEKRLVQGTGDVTVHVKSNLATLHKPRRGPRERTASSSTPQNATSTSPPDRGRPLAPSSSWSNPRFRPKNSKDSSKEDLNDVTPVPNNVGNAGPPTIRRFQSLGFLRRKRSTTISVAQSSSNMSQSTGSSHGHGTTHSNSSNGSSSQQQQQPQGQASQPAQPNRSHSFSASTVFPSLSRSSTFTLTVTTGPSVSSTNNPPPVLSARPPKTNRISRRSRSVSLYETSSAPKSCPTESTPLLRRRGSSTKRAIPLPPTSTRTVARTPCTYDVTSTRPSRPRSSSLPVDPALQAAIASTSQCTSRSEDKHTRSSHFSEAKEAQMIKAHGARRTSLTRPLNTSPSLTDIFSSYTLSPMTLRPQGTSAPATPRAHNRYAAVYRPPPPLDADGYARAGHPKPALSLSMPTGVSIIESLPLSNTLLQPPVSSTAARGISSRNASPSSPYPKRLSSLLTYPSSPPRPPPRASVPESPGLSPENSSKLLFTAASSPTVASPLQTNADLTPWVRQRAHSTATSPSWMGDERPTSVATHNYLTNSNATNSGPKPTGDNMGGAKNAASNKINYAQGGRLGTSNTRTIYMNTPTIPISNQRRPSLPATPTASEFSIASTHTDESLWVYFERSGLASPSNHSRELSRSGSANALSQTPPQSSHDGASIYEATLDNSVSTPPLVTTQLLTAPRSRDRSRGLSVNMGKSAHSVYVSSPSSSSSHTPQTPNSGSLQTPPLTSGASPSSPYTLRTPTATSPAPKINHGSSSSSGSSPNTIKLSSAHTIILREPPITRPQRAQRPTHLTSYSLPSPKADASFTILDPPVHSQVLYLDPARSRVELNMDSPSGFFSSPYPSPGVTFPVTPVTPMTPWIGSGKNGDGDADSLVLPPSPGRY